MNLRTMIDSALATLDEKDQPRMRAAMELGARFAVECVVKRNGYYNADSKAVMAELDGRPEPTPTPVPTTATESVTL